MSGDGAEPYQARGVPAAHRALHAGRRYRRGSGSSGAYSTGRVGTVSAPCARADTRWGRHRVRLDVRGEYGAQGSAQVPPLARA